MEDSSLCLMKYLRQDNRQSNFEKRDMKRAYSLCPFLIWLVIIEKKESINEVSGLASLYVYNSIYAR